MLYEKSKKKPANPHRKIVFISLILFIMAFALMHLFGERAYHKLHRIALSLTVANQQFVAMQHDDIVLVEFNGFANHYTVENLTDSLGGYARFPEWSPDGKWIAFDHDDKAEYGEADRHIYIMRADGSDLVQITSGLSPQWHPNKNILYFTDWVERAGIKSINLDTGNVMDVVRVDEDCIAAVGSFVSNYRLRDDEKFALIQIGHQSYLWGTEAQQCSPLIYSTNPIWSDDGTVILGNSGRLSKSPPQIYLDEADISTKSGDVPIQIINGSSSSVSPQGRYLAYDGSSHVNMLWNPTNWKIYLYDMVTGYVVPIIHGMAHPSWRPSTE